MAPARINDALHSQLSRGQSPAQLQIDDLARGPGRSAYGRRRVLEVSSRSALNDFSMGGHAKGVAWSLNPYVGCLHSCVYCYVPDTLRVERKRWGTYVVAKHNLPILLQRELRERPPRTTYVSTATDPYQSVEAEWRITRRCLALLARKDWPVEVLTRSPLVLRDVDVLRRFSRIRVGLSVPTLDDEVRRLLEPAAPPIPARLRTLRRLADRGLPVFANYAPAYPPTNGLTLRDVARAFRDAGVQWVNTSYWKRPSSFLGDLWNRFHRTEWEDLTQFIGSPPRQIELRTELARALGDVGIPLHTGFFNPPFEAGPPLPADGSAHRRAWEAAEGSGSPGPVSRFPSSTGWDLVV